MSIVAHLEGGPYDGYQGQRDFPFPWLPARIGVFACNGPGPKCLGITGWHLHVRELDGAQPCPPDGCLYLLAEADDHRVLYRYADMTLTERHLFAEATA